MITKFLGFLLTTSLDLLARREGLHLGTRTFLPMSTVVQYAPLHIFFSFVFFFTDGLLWDLPARGQEFTLTPWVRVLGTVL